MSAKNDVLEAEAARRQAIMAVDEAALNKIFADDYVYVHASGRVESKDAYIGSLLPKTFRFTHFADDPLAVKVYGDTAVVSGEARITRVEGANSKVNHFQATGVWVKGSAGWRCVHYQNSRMGG